MGPEIATQSRAFLAKLKAAVQARDKSKVSQMVSYPLQVNRSSKTIHIKNREEFVRRYDTIVNAIVSAKIIDEASSRCLFSNSQGFMIGDGEVWFKGLSPGVFKIITIN